MEDSMKRFNVTMTIEVEDKAFGNPWSTDVITEGVKEAIEDFYWVDTKVNSINVEEVGRQIPPRGYRAEVIDVITENGKLYANIRITTGEYKGICQRWRIA